MSGKPTTRGINKKQENDHKIKIKFKTEQRKMSVYHQIGVYMNTSYCHL